MASFRWVGMVFLVLSAAPAAGVGAIFSDDFEFGSVCAWSNLWYPDVDGDGWGDRTATGVGVSCPAPPGMVPRAGDCDDSAAEVHPGATEICNGIDDDCDDAIDNGSFADALEPNDSCATRRVLALVGSNETRMVFPTIWGQGDDDYYQIRADETDSSCSCCDGLCTDEDYQLRITLSVPAGAGSYILCTGTTCEDVDGNCVEVVAGTSEMLTWTLDGACSGPPDSYIRLVHIYGDNSPGYRCVPYTLEYEFVPGCF